jgi:hypothetical protein
MVNEPNIISSRLKDEVNFDWIKRMFSWNFTPSCNKFLFHFFSTLNIEIQTNPYFSATSIMDSFKLFLNATSMAENFCWHWWSGKLRYNEKNDFYSSDSQWKLEKEAILLTLTQPGTREVVVFLSVSKHETFKKVSQCFWLSEGSG